MLNAVDIAIRRMDTEIAAAVHNQAGAGMTPVAAARKE